MFERITDLDCNRCHGTYGSNDGDVLQVLYRHCFFSICPKCTEEVAGLMGFTKEELLSQYSQIKEAETENNKQHHIESGDLCKKCEKAFEAKEPRVREDYASNVESWHLNCYEK